MQRNEKRGMPVNIHEMIAAHVASHERQEAGRVDVTLVGNKYDTVAIADSKSTIDRGLLDFGRRSASFLHSFKRETAKGRSLSCFNLEGRGFRQVENSAHAFLALSGSQRLQHFAASD